MGDSPNSAGTQLEKRFRLDPVMVSFMNQLGSAIFLLFKQTLTQVLARKIFCRCD